MAETGATRQKCEFNVELATRILQEAVNAAVFGCYMNLGQICMSTERLIVHEKVADEFAAKLSATRCSFRPVIQGGTWCWGLWSTRMLLKRCRPS